MEITTAFSNKLNPCSYDTAFFTELRYSFAFVNLEGVRSVVYPKIV